MSIHKENTLWTEQYRPTTLATYIGNDHLKERIQSFIDEGNIPHLLFHGKPGTGKTSIAKMIVNSIQSDFLYINASDENGVDIIREKIKGFASTMGFSGVKIIILDECLDENTLVSVFRDGGECKIPIRDLDETSDLVKSWSVSKNRIEWKPFYLWDKGVQDVYEVELENGEVVVCTIDHKWYVEDTAGNVIVVKTKDLHKYNHILSP